MSNDFMRRVTQLACLLVGLLVAACSPAVSPSPTDGGGFPPVLNLENRGGPTIVVSINGSEVATIECNAASTLRPGEGGLPELPWTLSIVRQDDGAAIFTEQVNSLPQWFLQIGETPMGLGSTPPIGPAVTCTPSG